MVNDCVELPGFLVEFVELLKLKKMFIMMKE